MAKISRKLWGIFERILRKVLAAAKLYSRRPLTVICGIGLTILLQSLCIIGFWLLGRNMGMQAPIKYYFVFFPVAWLVGALPISIGALGIWEGTLKLLFGKVAIGLGEHLSALALGHRIIWLFGSLPGVVIHLVGGHLPKEIFIDYQRPVN